jgi:hypothetical protein
VNFPYLRYGCNFEINSLRTATYIQNRCEFCDTVPASMNVRVNGCPVLGYELDNTGTIVQAASITIPAADAPWVDASYPESARFMGFMITEVRKPSHVGRTVTPKISGFGGGILETLRAKAQEFEFEVLLFACDEAAMEYGFRYLTTSLVGGGCDEPCTLCDLEYRDSCHEDLGSGTPTLDEYNRGLWVLQNVGVTAAPEWLDPPMRGAENYFRRAKFSLASELPWKFTCPEICTTDETFDVPTPTLPCGADFDSWFCGESVVLCEMNEPSIVGETGAIIELDAGSKTLSGIEIQIIPDEFGWVADPDSAPPGFVNPAPCDLVFIRDLPAYHTLIYNTLVERVEVRLPTGEVVDGTPYLSFDFGNPPGFPVVRCGSFAVRVVVDECAVTAGTNVTISTAHREL